MRATALILSALSFAAFNASATVLDYRHEFRDTKKGDQRDRVLVANRFANGLGFSLEARWGQHAHDDGADHAFSETVSAGTEIVGSYLHKFDNSWSLEGGLSVDSTSRYSNYRPYLRGGYKFSDSLAATLRLRPYYKRISYNMGSESDTKETGYNVTTVINYTFAQGFAAEYELDYQKATTAGVRYSRNKGDEWTQNFKLAYQWSPQWRPYVELGNVSESGYTDNHQTRFRAGIQYSF